MSQNEGMNRRSFLKNTGMTALAGAVGGGTSIATALEGGWSDSKDNKYDFDEIYNRVGTDCIKWDAQIEKYGKENIEVPMGIADMDFKVAPAITKALMERVQHENWGYLDMPASYIESIIRWNKRHHAIDIDPDLLVHSDGVHPALLSSLKAFCPPGSKVIVQAPTYSAFYTDIRIIGCQEVENRHKLVNGRYVMDFEDLERCIDHDTHALILCNPQNPTGNVWSREDLMTLGEICTRRRVVVLSDEVHCDFIAKGNTFTAFSSLDNEEIVKNSMTFTSTSKAFSLAAMKVAYMFSSNKDYIDRVKATGHRQSLNTLGIVAAQAAFDECEDWLNQVVAYIDGTMDYVESFIGANMPLVKFVKPQGTYLGWLDVSEVVDRIGAKETAAEENKNGDPESRPVTPEIIVQRFFVEKARVHLNPGSSYGYGGAGRMRMNLATSRKLVELALNNMAGALRKI
jgi:cystathionine beta-lyase